MSPVQAARWYAGAAIAGVMLGAAYVLSPLTIWTLAAAPIVIFVAERGLPDDERRWCRMLFGTAFLVRALVVAAIFLAADHDNQAAFILSGDEAYALSRTLRIRNMLLGIPALKYDYNIAFDLYGRTSYLWVMTAAQMLFGPSPYGLRLLNAIFFLSGAAILFRVARRSFGPTVAFGGLAVLLFLPTLFLWSISLLKESLYFLLAAGILAATIELVRGRSWPRRVAAAAAIALGLYALRDLRTGAIALIGSGLALGLLLRVMSTSALRFMTGVLAIAALAAIALQLPAVQTRVMQALHSAANMHIGHVFTVGHPYKLLDEGFYATLDLEPKPTPPEAARFVLRAIVSFIVVPLPGQIATRGELAQLPEHLLWYAMILLAPWGVAAGLKRDRLVTCLLVGYVIPTAIVVALTNGNVGTLVRFRGLVTPYLVWIASLAFCVIIERVMAARAMPAGSLRPGHASLGSDPA